MKNNKKIIIVYLYSYIFRKFHWIQNECKYYKKFSNLEIHELYKIEHPHISHFKKLNFIENKYIKTFNNYREWKLHFINLINSSKKNNKKILVIKGEALSFVGILISFFLKKNKIDYVTFSSPAIPDYKTKSTDKNYISQIIFKFMNLIANTNYCLIVLKNIFVKKIEYYMNLKPVAIFASGKKWMNYLKLNIKNVKLIPIHSLDYSNYIINKNNIKRLVAQDYAVFINLADLGKESLSDTNIFKKNSSWIKKDREWHYNLNKFFYKIEKLFNLKVVIALHPKSEITKINQATFDYRKLFYNKTPDLVKYCKFVITIGSTAVSYAAIYKKPVLYICSNESKKDFSFYNYQIFLKNFLDSKILNINNLNIKKNDVLNYNINEKKYFLYKKNYLSCVKNSLPNYKIFYNNFLKNYQNNL